MESYESEMDINRSYPESQESEEKRNIKVKKPQPH